MPEFDESHRDAILAHYTWSQGDCFRCARKRLPTTPLTKVVPESNGDYDIRACEVCVLAIEADARRAAERRGEKYEPGRVGKDSGERGRGEVC